MSHVWVAYFAIGVVWGCGVAVARLLAGEFTCPPAASPVYVWLPVTIVFWPGSLLWSLLDVRQGFRESYDERNRK